jgi:hypothetical protein
MSRSGGLLYSGRSAWSGQRYVYLLGFNPGGDEGEGTPAPDGGEPYNLQSQIDAVLQRGEEPWSAYASESWKGQPPGEAPMQQRVLHLMQGLGLEPANTPASNLIFIRSRREAALGAETDELAEKCWPFHQHVIDGLGVRTILCMGTGAGDAVRKRLGVAPEPMDTFVETNDRNWTSLAHRTPDGRVVVTLTHPSRADWRTADADPVPMVRRVIEASRR